MPHHYHFRSSIDPQTIEDLARARGCESQSEYFRDLIREHKREVDGRIALGDGGE